MHIYVLYWSEESLKRVTYPGIEGEFWVRPGFGMDEHFVANAKYRSFLKTRFGNQGIPKETDKKGGLLLFASIAKRNGDKPSWIVKYSSPCMDKHHLVRLMRSTMILSSWKTFTTGDLKRAFDASCGRTDDHYPVSVIELVKARRIGWSEYFAILNAPIPPLIGQLAQILP